MIRKIFVLAVFLAACPALAPAQTIDDGVMVAKGSVFAGNVYTYDSWDQYWEGTLLRRNDNIGQITTRTNVWYFNYGLTDRVNLIGTVPYIWTEASQGVLHGIQGFQDLNIAAKYRFFERSSPDAGALRAFAVMSAGTPLADYNPELLPLSIGTKSTQVSWRGTVNYHAPAGWFVNGSGAYSWRSDVQLDRPYYYTNDQFVTSDQVDMPNAFDYMVSSGLMKPRLMAAGFLSQQQTLGGGDIRRQDMPFVSNRMNFFKAGGMVMVPVPWLRDLQVQLAVSHTFDGRNVGQSTTITTGLFYRFYREER